MYSKLKMWKECIRTTFYGHDATYNMHCNAIAVLKIDYVQDQSKYVDKCKYTDAGSQQCSILFDSDDNVSFDI